MSEDPVIAQIRALEAQRHQAMREADIATLDRLLSEQLVYTHSNATTDSKASYLEKVRSKFFDYVELATEEHRIFATGDVVFVTGRMIARVVLGGVERRLNNLTLGAWTREDRGWKFVVFQPTPIPPPA